MSPMMMLAAILLPILGGALVPVLPFKKRIAMEVYLEALVLATSVLVWMILAE